MISHKGRRVRPHNLSFLLRRPTLSRGGNELCFIPERGGKSLGSPVTGKSFFHSDGRGGGRGGGGWVFFSWKGGGCDFHSLRSRES